MEISKNMIGSEVTSWYKKNGRKDLPWRIRTTPYRVWISEMMLQQTQVNTAKDYFLNFIEQYPDLESIKNASEEEILILWKGLGYYRRAKFIYQAKEKIFKDYNGLFPDEFEDIISLPGIGKSTAGAILSIAYGKPFPILDANVKRVVGRLYNQESYQEKKFWELSKKILDKSNPFLFQQGIMDIGATICHIHNPQCDECPLGRWCLSKKNGSFYTYKKKKTPKKKVFLNYEIYKRDGCIYMIKNMDLGFWNELWMPPYKIVENNNREIKHGLSHRDLHLEFLVTSGTPKGGKWINKNEFNNLPTPKPISDKLEQYAKSFL